MACYEANPLGTQESEMEEGEIIDDLSDISSEEEFLLRQRLQVLEIYNTVLERKKAKKSSIWSGAKPKNKMLLCDSPEISVVEFDDSHITNYKNKDQKHIKTHHKHKRKKEFEHFVVDNIGKGRDNKRKIHRNRKKNDTKLTHGSSDESEDEYRNKRKKLADAVAVNRDKNDKTTLSTRLQKMLCKSKDISNKNVGIKNKVIRDNILSKFDSEIIDLEAVDMVITENIVTDKTLSKQSNTMISKISEEKTNQLIENPVKSTHKTLEVKNITDAFNLSSNNTDSSVVCVDLPMKVLEQSTEVPKQIGNDLINNNNGAEVTNHTTNNALNSENSEAMKKVSDKDSDEDIELLRQHALETKAAKPKVVQDIFNDPEVKIISDDEDSDTTELRLICLKSALLKKAIEMKMKQKLKKKQSQSSKNNHDDIFDEITAEFSSDNNNNTDIESVDMDIGSDADEKAKDCEVIDFKDNKDIGFIECNEQETGIAKRGNDEEIEEDEDLLRAKLLTSLSKNLSNLVNPNAGNVTNSDKTDIPKIKKPIINLADEKPFIIKIQDSDSEGEHEATENLTKMHMKLSEQSEFQMKLDMFLKSTRMEVEKGTLPDLVQQPSITKKPEKFVAKAVKHLPKSEQIEYKNLVKRMAELEKIKQSRQSSVLIANKPVQVKETLKPRNVTVDMSKFTINNNLDEQIAISRKKIAEESAKMLKLKEEGTKLTQKYKIVATELRNISTAITLNRKQQKTVQNCLTKIRLHHQSLLKSSKTTQHSSVNKGMVVLNNPSNKSITRLQKENNPSKEDFKNPMLLKAVKVNVVNDLRNDVTIPPRLSIQVDVTSNKKVVRVPKSLTKGAVNVISEIEECLEVETKNPPPPDQQMIENKGDASHPIVEKGGGINDEQNNIEDLTTNETKLDSSILNNRDIENIESPVLNIPCKDKDDYESPLQAFGSTTWEADPNAILCPFEVGGECKDPDCKYLHTPPPTT